MDNSNKNEMSNNMKSDRTEEIPGNENSDKLKSDEVFNETHTSDMSDNMETDRMMTGMFRDRASTENAYNNLHEKGYSKDDINLLMSDETRNKHFNDNDDDSEIGTKAMDGAGKGSAIGGTIGAIAGVIAAIGTSVLIPGLGLVIAGPIAAGLAGAGAGGITGGVIGALIGSGIPEEHAKVYESGIKDGGIVMGVKPRNEEDAKYFEDNWKENKGVDIFRN